ncbi:hypothetical protein GCK32_009793 [Trichostrongylus colubriformis]|uniref:Carboxylesterase type B domain-containing protein n=1 Tax=Trichostrongylus colubriformis TaxID=6319 RepID=A0AAN8F762_TRICO
MTGDLFLLACALASSSAQILELTPGKVQGFEYSTKGGDVAEVFLGIPYAAAPMGELRFEKPVPPKPWKRVHNGTEFGATCHPHTRHAILPPNPSEDCLTLNVIRPKKAAPPGGYPILLWVHGGGYEIGSASLYGYKGFADIYIPHDIIVVTIQYRLGVYGFFSSGDSRIPGNLGLFDMAAAVKFVYENAGKIGADASRLTAWGLSAGGAAHFIRPEFFTDKLDEVINKIIAYYVDRGEEDTYDFYLDRYTEFLSDVMFNVPAVDGILARRDKGWNLFAYSFNHYNKVIWSEDIPERMRGSTHINEYPYMFNMFPFGQYEIDEKEQIVADVIQQCFISFVKTGVPSNQHAIWQNIGTSTAPRHLAISPSPHMEVGLFNDNIEPI